MESGDRRTVFHHSMIPAFQLQLWPIRANIRFVFRCRLMIRLHAVLVRGESRQGGRLKERKGFMSNDKQNTQTAVMSNERISKMQTRILNDMDRIRLLPEGHRDRKEYIERIRQQQISAGIINSRNKLTKAFGG